MIIFNRRSSIGTLPFYCCLSALQPYPSGIRQEKAQGKSCRPHCVSTICDSLCIPNSGLAVAGQPSSNAGLDSNFIRTFWSRQLLEERSKCLVIKRVSLSLPLSCHKWTFLFISCYWQVVLCWSYSLWLYFEAGVLNCSEGELAYLCRVECEVAISRRHLYGVVSRWHCCSRHKKSGHFLCAISEAVVEDSRSLRCGESAPFHHQEVSLQGNEALPSFMTVLGPFKLGFASNRAW